MNTRAPRYSSPPSPDKLNASTLSLASSLDELERKVGGLPLPAGVAVAALDLTDEQRLAVCRELWLFMRDGRYIHMDAAVHGYEREAKERLAKGESGRVEG
jgi:hypothetical protein